MAEDPLTPSRAALASGAELRAIERLTKFLQENPGSILIDEANYLLGRAYLAQKDQVLAADYFQKVTRDFPQSKWAPDAAYYLAVSYDELSRPSQLDQDWTEKAIGSYRIYAARYPDRPETPTAMKRIGELEDRLARKAYENGALYLKMGQARSAEVYFVRVLEEFPQSTWGCKAALGLGEALSKRSAWREADEQLRRVIDSCPDKDVKWRAEKLLGKVRVEIERFGPAEADTAGPPDSASAP